MTLMYYTKEHEWVRAGEDDDVNVVTVGITRYAADQLGDVVFVDVPDIGAHGSKDTDCAVVESVKAASDVYWALTGEIVEVNQDVVDDPSIVNEDPEGRGWFYKMKCTDLAELNQLMNEEQYNEFIS